MYVSLYVSVHLYIFVVMYTQTFFDAQAAIVKKVGIKQEGVNRQQYFH